MKGASDGNPVLFCFGCAVKGGNLWAGETDFPKLPTFFPTTIHYHCVCNLPYYSIPYHFPLTTFPSQ